MSTILRQYIDEDGLQVTEYTRDGVTVSAIIRQPVPIEVEPIEPEQPVEPVETIDEKLERVLQQLDEQRKHNAQLAQSNLDLLDVNLTIYEELLYMQERLNNA